MWVPPARLLHFDFSFQKFIYQFSVVSLFSMYYLQWEQLLILQAHCPKSNSLLQGTKCDVREGEDVKNLVTFVQKNLKYIDIWVFTSNSSFSSPSPST